MLHSQLKNFQFVRGDQTCNCSSSLAFSASQLSWPHYLKLLPLLYQPLQEAKAPLQGAKAPLPSPQRPHPPSLYLATYSNVCPRKVHLQILLTRTTALLFLRSSTNNVCLASCQGLTHSTPASANNTAACSMGFPHSNST